MNNERPADTPAFDDPTRDVYVSGLPFRLGLDGAQRARQALDGLTFEGRKLLARPVNLTTRKGAP
jgi:hypothetical protein